MDERESLCEFLLAPHGGLDLSVLEVPGLLRFGFLVRDTARATRAEALAAGISKKHLAHLMRFGFIREEYGRLVLDESVREVMDIAAILAKGLLNGIRRKERELGGENPSSRKEKS